MQLKVPCHLGRLCVFVQECYLLQTVDGSLEILLRHSRDFSRLRFQIVAILQTQLVVCVMEIKSAAVDIYRWNMLYVAKGL